LENRGADTRVCGVETRLDAIPGLLNRLGIFLMFNTSIETSLDAAA